MKANPEDDGHFLRLATICLNHSLLEFNCCAERIHGASEFNQATVTFQSDHPAAAALGSWREPSVQMFQKSRNRAAFVPAHQPRRSNRVGKEDRRQPALLTRQ